MTQAGGAARGDGNGEDAGTTGDGVLDPQQAAALLDQATLQARRGFATSPALWVFRAFLALIAFGGFWLSLRHQHPYTGLPSGWALAVAFTLVAINIGWSTIAIRRAGAGVSGPTQRARQAWLGMMLAAWIVAYAVTAPLHHAGTSHPTWGLYPASAPLMFVGLVGAITAPARRDWPMTGICLAVAAIAAIAGFGGPAGAWLILAIGLCAALLCAAAYRARQQGRSPVRA